MKTIRTTVVMFILLATAFVVQAADDTRALQLESFDKISTHMHLNVYIKQGPVQEVTATGDAEFIDKLSLKVVNGKWEIMFKERIKGNFKGMTINITVPDIKALEIYGSGSIATSAPINTPKLELLISGSGSIDVDVIATNLTSQIKGSGNIKLKGSAQTSTINISGSGNVKSYELACPKVTVTTAGSGNSYVNATEILDVTISGSGNVHYRGKPETNVSIAGSGKVSKE